MIEIQDILLCIIAGLAAGIINTLAGSGSIITLSLLSFLGLPANIANGTNRIGLFFQSSASSFKFYKQGELSLKGRFGLLIVTLLSAVLGVYTASSLSISDFENVVGGIFCLLFLVVLLRPQNYLKNSSILTKLLPIAFAIIGFYAGFIQAGAGVFISPRILPVYCNSPNPTCMFRSILSHHTTLSQLTVNDCYLNLK